MADSRLFHPHRPEFEAFLYASVGEDRNGSAVTVLSTLARLNLDPWAEAAELAALGRDAALARLGPLLARSRDVPALGQDHAAVARDLTLLLPGRPTGKETPDGGTARPAFMAPGTIWAVAITIFVLLQILFFGGSGEGQ